MRKGLFGYQLRWMCFGALLVAAAVSCTGGADDPAGRAAERAEADSVDPDPTEAAAQADSTAILRSRSKLDRQQLAQLLGTSVPAGVGESCPVLGQVCATRSLAPTTPCNYTSTCDSSATQTGVWVDFICLNNNGNAVCTGVVQDQTVVTVACNRVTNGNACGTASCGAAFCLAYGSDCAETTTQVRNCTSAGSCSNDICTGQTTTQSAVGSCQRDTDGLGCSGRCQPTQVAVCRAGGCSCACPNSATSICLPGG